MRKSYYIWYFVVLTLLFTAISVIGGDDSGSITGNSINTKNAHIDSINKTFEEDSVYLWKPEKETDLEGVAITGNISGNGSGKVFLIKDNEKILIGDFFTQNETLYFSNSCEESCDMKRTDEEDHLLRIELEDMVKLGIEKITYSKESFGITSTNLNTYDLSTTDLNESVFYELKHLSAPTKNNDVVLKIENRSYVNESRLNYKPYGEERWYQYDLSNGTGVINDSDINREGSVEYFFNSTNHRFPENNNFKMSITEGFSPFENKAKSFSSKDPLWDSSCQPLTKEEFTCNLETLQSAMMLDFSTAYRMTRNETFINITNSLAVAPYDNGSMEGEARCDHDEGDFDCESETSYLYNGKKVSGARRQSNLIYSLWKAYQLGANESVKRLAEKYTNGSAEECDVWNGDFDCEGSKDQGLMMTAYWKAYEMTGKDKYSDIAINLSNQGLNYNLSVNLMRGFLKAYELSGEETYLNKSKELAAKHLNDCRYNNSCDPYHQALNSFAFWNLYEFTDNYEFLRAATDKTFKSPEEGCDPWKNNFTCKNPRQQGWMSLAYWKAYHTSENTSRRFYSPRFLNNPSAEEDLNLSVRFRHNISSPKIYYKNPVMEEFKSKEINKTTGRVMLSGNKLWKSGLYEYYFKDEGMRLPDNGTFKFIVSSENLTLKHKAKETTSAEPINNDIEFCTSNLTDNSCRLEYMQGWMMIGNSEGAFYTGNNTFLRKSNLLSESEVDNTTDQGEDKNGMYATCDHADYDYKCNLTNQNFPSDNNKKDGSRRQSLMIIGMANDFIKTGHENSREKAIKYGRGYPEECNVWDGEFDCNKSDNQGLMILAYWKLHKVTGKDTYKEIAINLTEEGLKYNSSPLLAKGLWRSYGITDNASIFSKAKNITSDFKINNNITPKVQAETTLSLWEAFLQTGNTSYKQKAVDFSSLKTKSDICNPNNDSYRCKLPNEQGLMSKAMWDSYNNYFTTELFNPFIVNNNLDNKTELKEGDKFNFSTNITNNETHDLTEVEFSLNVSSGLNISNINSSGEIEGNKVTFDKLKISESVLVRVNLEPTSSGDSKIKTDLSSKGGGIYTSSSNISISSDEVEESGGGGGGGGSSSSEEISEKNLCTESWICTKWSECVEGIKTRKCYDANSCDTNDTKPPVKKSCEVEECEENWNCTDWGECINGSKRRECYDLNSCESQNNKPIINKNCEITSEKKTNISENKTQQKTIKTFFSPKNTGILFFAIIAIMSIFGFAYYNRFYVEHLPFFIKWEVLKNLNIASTTSKKKETVRQKERQIYFLLNEAKDKIKENEIKKSKELYQKSKEIYNGLKEIRGYKKKMVANWFIDNLFRDIENKLQQE